MTRKGRPKVLKGRKGLTPDEIRRAIVAIEDGVAYTAVAARFGVSKQLLRRETGMGALAPTGRGLSIQRGNINRRAAANRK
jgi:transposase-like protein